MLSTQFIVRKTPMYRKVKVVHIIGVVLFFGSILGHAVAGIVSSASNSAQVLNIVREVIQAETYYLTIPGLVLFTVTGISMIVVGKLPLKKLRWLMVHVGLGVFVILNAVLVLAPVGQELLATSQSLVNGTASIEQIHNLESKEAMFGGFNIIACLLMVTMAVMKPKLGGG
jgi:uncharacterized membrane protein